MPQKGVSFGLAFVLRAVFYQRRAQSSKRITMSLMKVSEIYEDQYKYCGER